jgi:STE24 endopeptidase
MPCSRCLSRRLAFGSLVLAVLVCAAAAQARATVTRPNALDRRVDAIPSSALLSEPARRLVDPARQAAAIRLARWTLPGWIAEQLFEAAALAYFWGSGAAAVLRDRLRRRLRAEGAVRFLFGAALGLIARGAAFLPAFYLYRVDRVMQLSTELTRTWGAFYILHTLLAMIVAGITATVVLWLVDRTHQWYVYAIALILGISVVWSYASPYFQLPGSGEIRPLRGSLAAKLDRLMAQTALPTVPVFVERTRNSPAGRAAVLGWGASRRVVLTDTLLAGSTQAEVLYEFAYELGKIVKGVPVAIALIEGGIVIVFAAVAVLIADRIGFRRDDDSLSRLALLGALLAVVYIGAVAVRNAELRSYDIGADRYAVSLTRDPAAAVRALIRSADQQMQEVCPGRLATLFLDTEPGVGERVAAINGVPSGCR